MSSPTHIVLTGDLVDFGRRGSTFRNMKQSEIVSELLKAHQLLSLLPKAPPAAPDRHATRPRRNYDPNLLRLPPPQ